MPLARRVTLKLPPSSLVRLPLAFPPRASVSRPFRTLHEPFTPRVPPPPGPSRLLALLASQLHRHSPRSLFAARPPSTPLPLSFAMLANSPSHHRRAFYLPPRHPRARPPSCLLACLPPSHSTLSPTIRVDIRPSATPSPRVPLSAPRCYSLSGHRAASCAAPRRATHGHRFLPPYPTYPRHIYTHTHTHVGYV